MDMCTPMYITRQPKIFKWFSFRTAIRGSVDQENLESQTLSVLLWSRLQSGLRHLNLPFLGFVLVYGALIAALMADQHSGKGLSATAGAAEVPDSFPAFFPSLAGIEMSLWCCVLFSDSKVPNPQEMFSSSELVLGHESQCEDGVSSLCCVD